MTKNWYLIRIIIFYTESNYNDHIGPKCLAQLHVITSNAYNIVWAMILNGIDH